MVGVLLLSAGFVFSVQLANAQSCGNGNFCSITVQLGAPSQSVSSGGEFLSFTATVSWNDASYIDSNNNYCGSGNYSYCSQGNSVSVVLAQSTGSGYTVVNSNSVTLVATGSTNQATTFFSANVPLSSTATTASFVVIVLPSGATIPAVGSSISVSSPSSNVVSVSIPAANTYTYCIDTKSCILGDGGAGCPTSTTCPNGCNGTYDTQADCVSSNGGGTVSSNLCPATYYEQCNANSSGGNSCMTSSDCNDSSKCFSCDTTSNFSDSSCNTSCAVSGTGSTSGAFYSCPANGTCNFYTSLAVCNAICSGTCSGPFSSGCNGSLSSYTFCIDTQSCVVGDGGAGCPTSTTCPNGCNGTYDTQADCVSSNGGSSGYGYQDASGKCFSTLSDCTNGGSGGCVPCASSCVDGSDCTIGSSGGTTATGCASFTAQSGCEAAGCSWSGSSCTSPSTTPPSLSGIQMPALWPTGYWAPTGLLSCNNTKNSDNTIKLNCTSLADLMQTLLNILSFAMTIAIFVLAPIFFAWGGIMIMIAGASPDKFATGKKILTGTIIGVVIVLASYLIVSTFVSALGILCVGGFSSGSCPL